MSYKKTSLRTALSVAKGMGPAKNGTGFWWAQRITAIALVPLVAWFIIIVLRMTAASNEQLSSIIGSPLNAVVFILFIISGLYHGTLGMKEIVEDYIHHEGLKISINILLEFIKYITVISGIIAVITLHLSVFIGN